MSRPEIEADLETIDAALRGEDDGSELALLVADVRASAPPMSPGLERRIESVMAPRPKRAWRWRPVLAGGAVVAAVAAVVIALSVHSQRNTVTTFSRETAPPSTSSSSAATAGAPAPAPAVAGVQRRVQRDVSLALAAPAARF